MATLETQCKNYLATKPTDPMDFESWKIDMGKKLQEAVKIAQDAENKNDNSNSAQ